MCVCRCVSVYTRLYHVSVYMLVCECGLWCVTDGIGVGTEWCVIMLCVVWCSMDGEGVVVGVGVWYGVVKWV